MCSVRGRSMRRASGDHQAGGIRTMRRETAMAHGLLLLGWILLAMLCVAALALLSNIHAIRLILGPALVTLAVLTPPVMAFAVGQRIARKTSGDLATAALAGLIGTGLYVLITVALWLLSLVVGWPEEDQLHPDRFLLGVLIAWVVVCTGAALLGAYWTSCRRRDR